MRAALCVESSLAGVGATSIVRHALRTLFREAVAVGRLQPDFLPGDPVTKDSITTRGRRLKEEDGSTGLISCRLEELWVAVDLMTERFGIPAGKQVALALAFYLRGRLQRRGNLDWDGVLEAAIAEICSSLPDPDLRDLFALAELG